MKVLYLEAIPNDKRDFETVVILWRRQERLRQLTTWALGVVCLILFITVMMMITPQRTHVVALPLVMQGEKTGGNPSPEPEPEPEMGNVPELLYLLEEKDYQVFMYLPLVVEGKIDE